MLNFEKIIPVAAKLAGADAVVAAPFPLPETTCRAFATAGVIGGFIADRRPSPECPDPFVGGWWVDRSSGSWFIRSAAPRTMILVGAAPGNEISGLMLLEARLKGIRRIIFVRDDGSTTGELMVASALSDQLRAVPLANPVHELSYARMFGDIYSLLGDRLRLPPAAFVPDRILLLTGSLHVGGAERQAAYTASELARRFPGKIYLGRTRFGGSLDFFVPMVTAAGVKTLTMPEWAEEYESPEISDIRNQLGSRYEALGAFNIFYTIFHHALMIQTVRPGLVHAWQDYVNVLGGIAADLVGVPRLVLSGRSVAPDNFGIFQPYMQPGYSALFERRDVVFLNNSEAGARDYARWLDRPREQLDVVHNGFEFPDVPHEVRIAKRRELGIADDAIVVGSIIRFGEEKRPELLIEIAREIYRTREKVRFVVFGEGPLLEECRAAVAAEGLGQVVMLPGLASDAWAALAAMDIFVLTSRMEGLPNVMIEAQAVGLPVVSTGVGGMPETFVEGETGLAVLSADAGDMARSVMRLVDDEGLRGRMSRAAAGHAREKFGIHPMVDRTLAAYGRARPWQGGPGSPPDWADLDAPGTIRIDGALKDEGGGFVATLPRADRPLAVELWEDGHVLPLRAETSDEVRREGAGRYRIEDRRIFFSSSDGTDVRFNGRSYRLRAQGAEPEFDDKIVPVEAIVPELGHCFIADLGLGAGSERLSLWEDGRSLGPGSCLHDDIRSEGVGRYSVWGTSLYFSASDNTDPRANDRRYILRWRKAGAKPVDPAEASRKSLDGAVRRLLRNVTPREDFVPGRVVHVCGSAIAQEALVDISHSAGELSHRNSESVQVLYCWSGTKETRDFPGEILKSKDIPVRPIRRQASIADAETMPASLRPTVQGLPQQLALDIADLFWELVELRPEIVYSWLDLGNHAAAFAAVLAGVPRVVLSEDFPSDAAPAYRALLELPQVTVNRA